MQKYLSRKLVVTVLFGAIVPFAFSLLGISEGVTMASMALGGLYLGANAVVAKKLE